MGTKKQKVKSSRGAALKQQKMWEEIQAKREENRKARKKKITVIAVVLVLALAAIGGVIGFLVKKNASSPVAEDKQKVITGLPVQQAAEKKDIAAVRGLLLGPKGLWSYSKDAPTVEVFFSYGCPGCIGLEAKVGTVLTELAAQGKVNLIYHPVSTHPTIWEGITTDAALKVAKEDPEHFVAFHHKLMEAGYSIMYASEDTLKDQGNTGAMANPKESLERVKKAAQEAKVSKAVIDSFVQIASDKLPIVQWTSEWASNIETKVPGAQAATPTFFRNGSEQIDTRSWFDSPKNVEESLVKKK